MSDVVGHLTSKKVNVDTWLYIGYIVYKITHLAKLAKASDAKLQGL